MKPEIKFTQWEIDECKQLKRKKPKRRIQKKYNRTIRQKSKRATEKEMNMPEDFYADWLSFFQKQVRKHNPERELPDYDELYRQGVIFYEQFIKDK